MNLTPKTLVKLYAYKYKMSFQVGSGNISNYIYSRGVWLTEKEGEAIYLCQNC